MPAFPSPIASVVIIELPTNRQADNAGLQVKRWRVESEKFAIQLAIVDKEMEGMALGQALARPLA